MNFVHTAAHWVDLNRSSKGGRITAAARTEPPDVGTENGRFRRYSGTQGSRRERLFLPHTCRSPCPWDRLSWVEGPSFTSRHNLVIAIATAGDDLSFTSDLLTDKGGRQATVGASGSDES
jgi:hypothetical protein